MTDYTELKRLAEAVKQTYADLCEHGGDELAEAWESAELAYDEAANPDVVMSLIATIDVLRSDTESRCEWINEASAEIDRLQSIEVERDELKAESEALRQSVADHKACIASDNELFREANLECNRYHSVIVAVGELLGISKEEQDEEEATQEELVEAINELWGQVHGMQEDLDEYKSEHESLRKNAKRFQYWLRSWSSEEEANLPRSVEQQMHSDADLEVEDAFDAAMGKGEQS